MLRVFLLANRSRWLKEISPVIFVMVAMLTMLPAALGQSSEPFPGMQSPFRLNPLNRTLFYIQRNKNANTVFYDANFKSVGQLDIDEPIDVYYIHYAKDGKRSELSLLERSIAYGYHFEQTGPNRFQIKLKAFPGRKLELTLEQGQPRLYAQVSGQKALLTHIYVNARPPLYTSVVYVDIWGTSVMDGHVLYERIYNR